MTTYSVQDTLITALRVLHEWIFALWVTYSLSSFTFNRRENWSTENRAHLPEFTAHKWWCWYLHPGDWETWPFRELALVTRETGKEGDRAQQRGRDPPIGPRVTDPRRAGASQHCRLVGVALLRPSLPPCETWQGTEKARQQGNRKIPVRIHYRTIEGMRKQQGILSRNLLIVLNRN